MKTGGLQHVPHHRLYSLKSLAMPHHRNRPPHRHETCAGMLPGRPGRQSSSRRSPRAGAEVEAAAEGRGPGGKEEETAAAERECVGTVWKLDGRLVTVNGTLDLKLRQGHILEMGGGGGGARAVLLWERQAVYFAYLLPGSDPPSPGEPAYITEEKQVLMAGPEGLEGEFLDMFGNRRLPEGKGQAGADRQGAWPTFNPVPQQQDLQTIRRSLLTGITAVDSMAPIGMGQNMMVIGEPGTGKTALAASAAIAQKGSGVRVIYADLKGAAAELEAALREGGAMSHTTVVTPAEYGGGEAGEGRTAETQTISEAEAAARRVIAASTAVSIGEHVRSGGGDALVILDDLRGHQDMWRHTCDAVLDAAGGFNVFQGADDSAMRQFYSNLFQRVGRFSNPRGGGSLSMMIVLEKPPPPAPGGEEREYALEDFEEEMINDATRSRIRFLVEKGVRITTGVLRKLEIPAPGTRSVETLASIQDVDSLISLSDGHIMLDPQAFASGRIPAVDPSNSLTRVGIGSGVVQGQSFAPVITKVAPRARLEIAQMLRDRDQVRGERLSNRIAAWDAILTQRTGEVLELAKQSVFLFAVRRGDLDEVSKRGGSGAVRESLEGLWKHCQEDIPGVLQAINETQDISSQELEELSQSVDGYFAAEMAPTMAAAL